MAEMLAQLDEARLRSDVLLHLLHKFLQARSEKQILEAVMQVGADYLGVNGASFVPYDEWGLSLPALVHGSIPGQGLKSWEDRLGLPETRQVCKNCVDLQGDSRCVLLADSQKLSAGTHVHCFPLSSAGRQVGVFNFFFDGDARVNALSGCIKTFFADILDATGQALENAHSHYGNIAGFHSLQQQSSVSATLPDLSSLLNRLLVNVQQVLDVDFAMLYLPGLPAAVDLASQIFLCSRNGTSIPKVTRTKWLDEIWMKVMASGHSLWLDDVSLPLKMHDVWAAPVPGSAGYVAGVLVLGSMDPQKFGEREQAVVDGMVGVVALLIQNKGLMVQVEYQAVVDERLLLAREMHDGLSQTLAFLKIQAAQMQNYLASGDNEKLAAMLQASHRTLADAYVDARQAIDDLRRMPSGRLSDWIAQVAADFEQATSLRVEVRLAEFATEYPANIQAQLIRIVQEALSNIRKHAGARSVSIVGSDDGQTVLIEVRDDGRGFSPESVDGNSRYGLLGMRERAESIGADFQITSQLGVGTQVSLRIPVLARQERRGDAERFA